MRRKKLLIAIDLGNTTGAYGVYEGIRLKGNGYVPTYKLPLLAKYIKRYGASTQLDKAIICSVVPAMTIDLIKILKRAFQKLMVYIVGNNVCPHVRMRYERRALGADRLVNIYGGIRLYKVPLLIVDFGTAITFDYVSDSGIFEGGLIVPGVENSWTALKDKTALLPKGLKIRPVRAFVGRNTESAMRSGILNGFGALTDGLIERFRKKGRRKLTVLGTGGGVRMMKKYVRGLNQIDPLHTIRSLALIYRNEVVNKKNRCTR